MFPRDGMEILTSEGFRDYDALQEAASAGKRILVASLHHQSKSIQYFPITEVVESNGMHKMVEITQHDEMKHWQEGSSPYGAHACTADRSSKAAKDERSNHVSLLVTEDAELFSLWGKRKPNRNITFEGRYFTDPVTGKKSHVNDEPWKLPVSELLNAESGRVFRFYGAVLNGLRVDPDSQTYAKVARLGMRYSRKDQSPRWPFGLLHWRRLWSIESKRRT